MSHHEAPHNAVRAGKGVLGAWMGHSGLSFWRPRFIPGFDQESSARNVFAIIWEQISGLGLYLTLKLIYNSPVIENKSGSIAGIQLHICFSPGQLQVIGPSQPVVALVGDDVTLPCRLEPATDASDMRLEWARPDLSPGFVYVRAKGQERVAHRQPSYRGRTSVSIDRLKDGDVSLKLATVKVSDEGTYRCIFPELGRAAFINLIVGKWTFNNMRWSMFVSTQLMIVPFKPSCGLLWLGEPTCEWLLSSLGRELSTAV